MKHKIIISKKISIIILLAMFCQNIIAQYTVTKIVGQVKNRSTGERLVPGSKLKDDDLLEFSTPKDLVRVIVSGKGIYIISPTPGTGTQQSFIVEMLKSALKIKSREGYLSGRSEESDLVPAVFERETSVSSRNYIGPENHYLFDTTQYSMTNGNRFFLQTEQEGKKPVIRALRTNADTLYLAASDFTTGQKATGQTTYTLGFFDKSTNASQSLAVLMPYIDSTNEMESIIKLIQAEGNPSGDSAIRKSAYAEVYEALGKPAPIDFNRTYDRISGELSKKEN